MAVKEKKRSYRTIYDVAEILRILQEIFSRLYDICVVYSTNGCEPTWMK